MANQQQHQSFVVNNQPNVYRIQNGTLIQPLHSNPQLNGQKAQNSGALPTYQQATNPAQLQANGWQAFQMQRGLNYMPAPNPLNGQQTNQHLEGSRPNSVQSNNLNQSNGGRSESHLGTQQSSGNLSNGNQQFGVFPSQQHQYAQQYQAMRPMPAQFMHPQMQNFLQYQNPLQAMQAMQYVQLGSKNVNPAQALNSNNAVQQKVCTKCHTPADKLTRQMCKKCYNSVRAKEQAEEKRRQEVASGLIPKQCIVCKTQVRVLCSQMCRNCYQRGWHRQKRLKAQEQAMLLMQNQGQQQTSFDRQMPVTPNNNAAFNLQDIIRGIVTPPISLNTYLEQLNGSEISVGRCTSSSSNAIDSGSISIQSRLSTPQLTINESPIGDRVINEPEVIYLDQETEPFPREVSPVPLNEIYQAIGQQAAPVEFILLSSGSEDES